jgi:polyhydroxybutyrate depolymerase
VKRHYILHIPASYSGLRAVPLVLNFHGASSNAWQEEALSGMSQEADREGFTLA